MGTDQDGQALVSNERQEPGFGDLNSCFAKKTGPYMDRSGGSSFMGQMQQAAAEVYKKDALAGTGPYKAIVLRKEPEQQEAGGMSGWMKALFPGGHDGKTISPIYMSNPRTPRAPSTTGRRRTRRKPRPNRSCN